MIKIKNKKRVSQILNLLKFNYRTAKITLDYGNNFQLLVAVMLSAQTTDKKVNEVTKKMFKKYKTAYDFAKADNEELENAIKSIGLYKNKARNVKRTALVIVKKYKGSVPKTMEELTSLPGVGRKTANVVLGNAFKLTEGIVVDTHVKRVSKKLRLTKNNDPKKIELDLMKSIPKKYWLNFSYWLIFHGRKICQARNPKCNLCFLKRICPSAFKFPHFQ